VKKGGVRIAGAKGRRQVGRGNPYTGGVLHDSPEREVRQKPVRIDWMPFLGRPALPRPGADALRRLRNASIVVTGAAGSIGSRISLRLAELGTRSLVLVDNSEQGLFELAVELDAAGLGGERTRLVLGSVADVGLLGEVFGRYRPEIVFHAAAYKHLPLLEAHPLAAVANNTLATRTLCQAAERHGRARVVLLSTDKAVEPTSILGASKRIAERIVAAQGGVVVRLANVLGSRGNVVEKFLKQLAAGVALTITNPVAERYFVTIEEARDLLLAAAVEADAGSVLAPALERAHKIGELAEFLAGLGRGEKPVRVEITALHAGEKLRERLWSAEERAVASPVAGLVALESARTVDLQLEETLDELETAVRGRELERAMELVELLAPGYEAGFAAGRSGVRA